MMKKVGKTFGVAVASVTVTSVVSEKEQAVQIITELKDQLKAGQVKFS